MRIGCQLPLSVLLLLIAACNRTTTEEPSSPGSSTADASNKKQTMEASSPTPDQEEKKLSSEPSPEFVRVGQKTIHKGTAFVISRDSDNVAYQFVGKELPKNARLMIFCFGEATREENLISRWESEEFVRYSAVELQRQGTIHFPWPPAREMPEPGSIRDKERRIFAAVTVIAERDSSFAPTVRGLSNLVTYRLPPQELARLQLEEDLQKLGLDNLSGKTRKQAEAQLGPGAKADAADYRDISRDAARASWLVWKKKVEDREYKVSVGLIDDKVKFSRVERQAKP
jgi:hypothetical protein